MAALSFFDLRLAAVLDGFMSTKVEYIPHREHPRFMSDPDLYQFWLLGKSKALASNPKPPDDPKPKKRTEPVPEFEDIAYVPVFGPRGGVRRWKRKSGGYHTAGKRTRVQAKERKRRAKLGSAVGK